MLEGLVDGMVCAVMVEFDTMCSGLSDSSVGNEWTRIDGDGVFDVDVIVVDVVGGHDEVLVVGDGKDD